MCSTSAACVKLKRSATTRNTVRRKFSSGDVNKVLGRLYAHRAIDKAAQRHPLLVVRETNCKLTEVEKSAKGADPRCQAKMEFVENSGSALDSEPVLRASSRRISRRQFGAALATTMAAVSACTKRTTSGMNEQNWGKGPNGEDVALYTLSNADGVEATITTYGGRLVTLRTPDRNGKLADIVLGFDILPQYLEKNPFFGALVGRYANRIANGQFQLNGHTYTLAKNNGPNTLHGGLVGFDKKVWKVQGVTGGNPALRLQYISKDGEEGFPGTLTTTVTYELTSSNELKIDYEATTDQNTVLNLTNHSYFDLSGAGAGDITDHIVTINADRFTPVDANLIPTGELKSVDGTPFDFRKPTAVGARINDKDQQLVYGGGYDHNFVLNRSGNSPSLAARVMDPKSGRVMEVLTTQPGVQFYTGNHLPNSIKGKNGATYNYRYGLCFETQHFPNSPNQPSFPTTELRPGERFHQTTIFKFSVA